MKTIESIEKGDTNELRKLLKYYEEVSEYNEVILDYAKENNADYDDLYKKNLDYEIDIVLIRRELNRRLWYDN